METRRFAVVGAGLGGTLMAVYLGQAGHDVDVYERRPDPRARGAAAGRSINLAISTRALHALREVGLEETVLATAVPMRGRMMHPPSGALTFQPYGTKAHHTINSVSRGGLNTMLLEAADRLPNVRLHFDCRCRDVDLDTATLVFDTPTGEHTAVADAIVGADGAFSAVRGVMQRTDRFDYQQEYLQHGYKELTIPPAENGGFRLERNALHIWPRGGFMMIALPNRDGSFTCTLFWPFDGPTGFNAVRTPDEIRRFFDTHFADAVPLMPALCDEYLANPTSSLVTVRSGPWYNGGRVVLLGDASHAIVPFYGQGANAAFEDCMVLAECLRDSPADFAAAFARYYARRKIHADALADLAIANFIEMRDLVASPAFLMKKRFEKVLHRMLPRWYVPLYTMVSFSRIPYADAVTKARQQDVVVKAVLLALVVVVLVGLILS